MIASRIFTLLICCVGLFCSSAHALVSCTDTPSPTAVAPQNGSDANRIAQLLAAKTPASQIASAPYAQYVSTVEAAWRAYEENVFKPLTIWSAREVHPAAGHVAFYPFSGPDLPTVLAIYPSAARIVLASDQYPLRYLDPFALKGAEQAGILLELGEAWTNFGQRGFFVTQELNRRGSGNNRFSLTPTMIMMAFAARLGYEIRSIQPICLDMASQTIRPITARDANWNSVRLSLRKDGRDLEVDYLQQDLSNHGLAKRPGVRLLIESLSKNPVLLKAASHLPQQPSFSILRDALLVRAPLVVQDETGLDYELMVPHFHIKLHGQFVGAHHLFREFTNPSLRQAYRDRNKELRPLDFKLGYEKAAGSAVQVAIRK